MRLVLDDLVIAPLATDDISAFVAYRSDPDVARYQSWSPDYSGADARELVESQTGSEFPAAGEWMQFAIRSSSGDLLGDVAVHVLDDQPDTYELGVTVSPAAQGRGIARAALGATIDHLVGERGAHRVILTLDERNAAMRQVCVALGLRQEGTARDADWFKGEWTTVETWAVLGSERSRGA
jgi:RimJ/RimL family protein N-acetyltransferase